MSIVPVHPLQLPNQVPAFGRWEAHDENRWGCTLYARGLAAGDIAMLQPQRASVHGNTNAVIGNCEVKSTLVATANGYEGLGLYISALKRNGDQITRVWHNNLLQEGNTDYWLNDLPNEWARGQIIVQIPEEHQPDFIDSAWIVRGTSGQIKFDAVGLYDYFISLYRTNVNDATWTNFTYLLANDLFAGRDAWVSVHYIDTHIVRISKGQKISYSYEALIQSAEMWQLDSGDVRPQKFQLGLAFKLLKRNGQHTWRGVGGVTADKPPFQEWGIRNEPLGFDGSFIAEDSYTQMEVVMYLWPYESANIGLTETIVDSLKVKIIADQQVETGSE